MSLSNYPPKDIAIILHHPDGSIGLLEQCLLQRPSTLDIFCPLNGDALPHSQDYDAVIVMGGKMSANDQEQLPALKQELAWIRTVIEQNKPFLGICLGAQLLAMALGGSVTRHPARIVEIGYYQIYPTIDGYRSIFANAPSRFFQWHNEGFSLPDGAVKLAESDLYPYQAFSWGERAFGFQFHPEATLEQMQLWHSRDVSELAHPGAQTIGTQLQYNKKLTPHIQRWLMEFIDYWLYEQKEQKWA